MAGFGFGVAFPAPHVRAGGEPVHVAQSEQVGNKVEEIGVAACARIGNVGIQDDVDPGA